jgi:hypothetical protein
MAANPVTVNGLGGADFTTIQAAIDSWCPGGANYGETPPFTIKIYPVPVYDEMLTLDDVDIVGPARGDIKGALNIQSTSPGSPATIKVRINPASPDDGFWVYQSRFNITFTDLLFCPSKTGNQISDDLVKVDENPSTTPSIDNTISFIRCIFTDITAGGDPAVKSKAEFLAKNYPGDMTAFVKGSLLGAGDALLKCWGDPGEKQNYIITDCVFFIKDGRPIEAVLAASNEIGTITDSLFASGGAGSNYVIEARPTLDGDLFTIQGTLDPRQGDLTKCTAALCGGYHALYVSGGVTTPIGSVVIKNVLVDIDDVYGTSQDYARVISGGVEAKLVEDSILSVKTNPGNNVDYPMVANSVYNRVTFHMPRTIGTANAFFYLGTMADPFGIILNDCVISGTELDPPSGTFDVGGFTLNNCAIATSGVDAITSLGTTVVYNNCKFVDPSYLSYSRTSELFMDTSNVALANAATDITGIGGGGHYRGPDASDNVENAFKDWGDCENDVFTSPSGRSSLMIPAMLNAQNPVRGVIGNALKVNQNSGARMEGSSDTELCNAGGAHWNGKDIIFKFYYKFPQVYSSYPRIAVQRDRLHSPVPGGYGPAQGQIGDSASYKEWTNSAPSAWVVDSNWHLFSKQHTTDFIFNNGDATWDATNDCDIFCNNYCNVNWVWYMDEIIVDDPSVNDSVGDWGLF